LNEVTVGDPEVGRWTRKMPQPVVETYRSVLRGSATTPIGEHEVSVLAASSTVEVTTPLVGSKVSSCPLPTPK